MPTVRLTIIQSSLQEYNTEKEEPIVDSVISFKWEIEDFPTNMGFLNTSKEPLTSNVVRNGRGSWRALLTQDMDLFLQLVSAANPVTVEIRYKNINECMMDRKQ